MARTALIIDDEKDIATYLATILSDHGWDATTANSADEGLAAARSARPDVVLLDLMMPDRGGLSTLAELKRDPDLKSVPVVVVTAIDQHVHNIYGSDEEFSASIGRARTIQPDAYVPKPVEPEKLMEVIENVAGESGTT